MRKAFFTVMAGTAFLGTTQAASACDLEGFGFTRVNPFGLSSSWGVPQDHKQSQPASADQTASVQSARQNEASTARSQSERETAERPRADRASATTTGFVPVSAEAAASQAQRFTGTKD
ncbi:hypothetical protein [Blastomonas sp.]|uniref:hypothetical protein n=1 Tax=Blastomonas sp. TaxID=1909299 RepID=UPI00260A96F1|nr:hypothetical protein [Blastomonas sp.]MDM7956631.1 hypothetical protein [Blastomonas sp.]